MACNGFSRVAGPPAILERMLRDRERWVDLVVDLLSPPLGRHFVGCPGRTANERSREDFSLGECANILLLNAVSIQITGTHDRTLYTQNGSKDY